MIEGGRRGIANAGHLKKKVETFKIEAGSDKYKPLENMVLAGSHRFVLPATNGNGMTGVEARVSVVESGTGME